MQIKDFVLYIIRNQWEVKNVYKKLEKILI